MKKNILIVSFILCIVADLSFLYLSILNLIYFNSKTVGINIFGYNITADGISIPLHLITILFLIITVFLFFKLKEMIVSKKKNYYN